MRCSHCDNDIPTGSPNCPGCGAPIEDAKPNAAAPRPAAPRMVAPPPSNMAPQAVAPPPKKSHFLRNCLICGCFLIVLAIGGFVATPIILVSQLKKAVVTQQQAPALASALAPGATPPNGFELKGGIDFSFLGFKAKGVAITPKGAGSQPQTLIAFGGFSQKQMSQEQLHESVQKFLSGFQGGGASQQNGSNKIVSQAEEDLPIGPGGDTVKAQHLVTEDERTQKRSTEYLIVLEPYSNEFGYLVIVGVGPEKDFDEDAFTAFLKTVHTK